MQRLRAWWRAGQKPYQNADAGCAPGVRHQVTQVLENGEVWQDNVVVPVAWHVAGIGAEKFGNALECYSILQERKEAVKFRKCDKASDR